MPKHIQNIASAAWPIALLVMVIFVPFAVRKSYDEKRSEFSNNGKADRRAKK